MTRAKVILRNFDGEFFDIDVPWRYFRGCNGYSEPKSSLLTAQGGAFVRGAVARARHGDKAKNPYSDMEMQGRGFRRAWQDGFDHGHASKAEEATS